MRIFVERKKKKRLVGDDELSADEMESEAEEETVVDGDKVVF